MRAPVLACLVFFGGCIIDNNRVRVESFVADPAGTFATGRRSRSDAAGSPRNSPPTACATADMSLRPASSWSRRIRRIPMPTTSFIPAAAFDELRRAGPRSSARIGLAPPFEKRPRLAVDGIVSR